MISTRFQQSLIDQGRALQDNLKATLATRDQNHPNPDPDPYEGYFRELVRNPLNTLSDVRAFLIKWHEYQTKQAIQPKRSRSLGDVMVSHQDRRGDLLQSLNRLISDSNSVISSIETLAWLELASALELKAIKENAKMNRKYRIILKII